MARSVLSRLMWVGRATVFCVGLAVVLAVILGVSTTALAAIPGDPFKLGRVNKISALTQLVGNRAGAMLLVDNNSVSSGARALDLRVEAGKAPMTVNDTAGKAANLNADKLDGLDSTQLAPRSAFGAAGVINQSGPLPIERIYTSKGGTLIISASGSGFRPFSSNTIGWIGMAVLVDGSLQPGEAYVYTNEKGSHKAFVANQVVVEGLPAGPHTIQLVALRSSFCETVDEQVDNFCTSTDPNDNFNVTVVEIPD